MEILESDDVKYEIFMALYIKIYPYSLFSNVNESEEIVNIMVCLEK
jgi:hypothetical protein